MSNNKPLLFIDTVQTKINQDIGQNTYDSRSNKPKVKREEVEQVDEVKQDTIDSQENPKQEFPKRVLTEEEQKEKSSKLTHQINLLDKRAKQEHYVYIEIISKGESLKGFFKGFYDNLVLLEEVEEGREIKFEDIESISILKV